MNRLQGMWWPFGLLGAGALLLWGLGYTAQDRTEITLMALLIAAAGGYLVLIERQKRK